MLNADGNLLPPLSPYFLFAKERVNQIKISNPDCPTIEMMKMVNSCWKTLSVEDKKVYYDSYIKGKEEFDKFQTQLISDSLPVMSNKDSSFFLSDEIQRED